MVTKHLIIAFFCAAGLACGTAKAQTTIKIGVSVPSADHGWTGGIDFFAEESKEAPRVTSQKSPDYRENCDRPQRPEKELRGARRN